MGMVVLGRGRGVQDLGRGNLDLVLSLELASPPFGFICSLLRQPVPVPPVAVVRLVLLPPETPPAHTAHAPSSCR